MNNPHPIPLPELGTTHAEFGLWYVCESERVCEGDRLAEVVIPGAIVEVAAPCGGIVQQLLVRPGDRLHSHQSLGTITPDTIS